MPAMVQRLRHIKPFVLDAHHSEPCVGQRACSHATHRHRRLILALVAFGAEQSYGLHIADIRYMPESQLYDLTKRFYSGRRVGALGNKPCAAAVVLFQIIIHAVYGCTLLVKGST